MKITGNNVLVEPLNQPKQSDGGIALPPHSKYQWDNMQFRVLAVGPGRVVRKKGKPDVLIPIDVEVGDCVLCEQIHGNKFAFEDGSRRLIVEADELIAKWKPPIL